MRTAIALLAGLSLAAALAPVGSARADDVLVPEDSLVAAARRLDASTVVVRVSRSGASSVRDARLVAPSVLQADEARRLRFVIEEWRVAVSQGGGRAREARGFFVGDGRAVLTSASAVAGAGKVEIVWGGKATEAVLVASDADFDLALLRSSVAGPPLEVDPAAELEPGRLALVGGAGPGGVGIDLAVVSSRVTSGARRGWARLARALPEESAGGPVLGADGRVRGIVASGAGLPGGAASAATPHLVDAATGALRILAANEARLLTLDRGGLWESQDSGMTWRAAQGGAGHTAPLAVAHLIPGRRIARALADLLEGGRIRKAYLGLVLGVEKGEGAAKTLDERAVARLLPGSPAEGALRVGDRILAVGGRTLSDADDVTYEIFALAPGKPASIRVERTESGGGGVSVTPVDVTVTPAERTDDATARGPRVFGFLAVALTPELRLWLGDLAEGAEGAEGPDGVVVASVTQGGAADRAGMKRGDRLTKFAGRDVLTVADVSAAVDDGMRRLATGEPVDAVVVREGRTETLHLLAK